MGVASLIAMALAAAIFLPKLLSQEAYAYRDFLIGATLKLLFLLVAGVYASRSARSFERGNPVWTPWLLLAIGLWAYVTAQSILAFYQVVLQKTAPFPSLADLFFVPATVLIAASLFLFVRVYRSVGFEIADPFEVALVGFCALSLLSLFAMVVARPILSSEAPLLERVLNVFYPVIDCILLIPAALLLKMALSMRGGSLWKVWMTLLLGFVFLALGDIGFAFFTTLGKSALDPLLDLAFAWSYILIARAVVTQHSISGAPATGLS
jgi:hypothetical protein